MFGGKKGIFKRLLKRKIHKPPFYTVGEVKVEVILKLIQSKFPPLLVVFSQRKDFLELET